jgi:phenylalanyl-tRNA synthetase alpha chain
MVFMVLNFTEIDAKVYELIKKEKEISLDDILNTDSQKDKIRRSIETLKLNGVIEEITENYNVYELDLNGIDALENGFIEERFCDYLSTNKINISQLNNLNIPNLKKEDITLAFGISKKAGFLIIENGIINVDSKYKQIVEEQKKILDAIKNNQIISESQIQDLLKRKEFIIKKEKQNKKYKLLNIINYEILEDKELYLTPEMLRTEKYKTTEFKEFDVTKLPPAKEMGRLHPLRLITRRIRDVYLQMGFKEMKGPYVETSFWNMDAMFISQNHPARDMQDTFYLNETGDLPKNKDLILKVSEIHNNGWKTGSKGYQYDWNEQIAKKLLLRTHTTATTYRTFYNLSLEEKENSKYFCIDKVFRNETIDYTHLPEFHQAEGFIIGDELSLADLMAFIKEFFSKFGITKVRFKPTYNPYTEPSVEASGYHEKTNTWIELINARIFRPESLAPFGINKTVIAWGFGVERLAMFIYQKPIKDIHGNDANIEWLREYIVPSIE